MSLFSDRTFRNYKDNNKKKSSTQINQNILNYFNKVNERSRIKKIASLNDKKTEIIKNNKSENFQIDYETKNKAKKSLLYLLNIKSKGIFCPQIINYFKKIKESKKIENKLLEIKEESLEKQIKINLNDNANNNYIQSPKLKSKFFQNKNKEETSNVSQIKIEGHIKNQPSYISEENNIINNNNEINNEIKYLEILKDNQNLNVVGNSNNNFICDNKEPKINNDIIEELSFEYKENKDIKSVLKEKNTKKKSPKKRQKTNKIDMIYNLQRSEVQKFGNYHSSLRTAIQSNISRKKIINKKK